MKWMISAIFGMVLATAFPAAGFPEDADAPLMGTVTVQDLIAYAYQNNPSIQKVHEAWRETVEQYRITTGYPDPELTFSYFPEPIETRLGPQDWTAALNQKIPFPGKLTQAGKVVEIEARVAHISLDRTIKAVMASVRESYHELLYIRTAKQVVARNLELLKHLRKVAETGYAKDRAALMDMVKAQAQLGQIRYDGILLDELAFTEITRLNGLLNRPPDETIGRLVGEKVEPVVLDLKELYRLAEANEEEIRMAKAMVEKAGAEAELAKLETLPDFKVGFFYASIGTPDVPVQPRDAGRNGLGIQVGITIPLWFEKNRGRVAKARAGIRKARAAKEASINDIRTSIHNLFFHLGNSRRLIQLYGRDLLPQAERAMEIAETWYREGESSFSDFVETQAVYYNFQLSLARAKADYGKYLARLEQLVGQRITKAPRASNPESQGEMK
ncbi:MAG: TolC family protein [Deltaproteobacteria bacterium]|nr:TolC family protein [Deltaproteobacteria bacterium]